MRNPVKDRKRTSLDKLFTSACDQEWDVRLHRLQHVPREGEINQYIREILDSKIIGERAKKKEESDDNGSHRSLDCLLEILFIFHFLLF